MTGDPIVLAARFLLTQLSWIRHATDGHEACAVRAYAEIADCASRMRSVVNGPAEQKYLGPCGAIHHLVDGIDPEFEYDQPPCEGDVYAPRGAANGRCRTCGATVATAEREAWLDGEVRQHAFRASEIANAYGLKANTIRVWHARGRLHEVSRDRDERPLFNVGDVLDLAAADAARREASRAKRAARGPA